MNRDDVLQLAAVVFFIIGAVAAEQADGTALELTALTWVALGLALLALSFLDLGRRL